MDSARNISPSSSTGSLSSASSASEATVTEAPKSFLGRAVKWIKGSGEAIKNWALKHPKLAKCLLAAVAIIGLAVSASMPWIGVGLIGAAITGWVMLSRKQSAIKKQAQQQAIANAAAATPTSSASGTQPPRLRAEEEAARVHRTVAGRRLSSSTAT